jgi:hypothetical protein
MRLMPIDPTAIVLDALYLVLAQAGNHYTGYIGGTYFVCGRATVPVIGSVVQQGLLNGVHIYPYQASVTVDWSESTPRVHTVAENVPNVVKQALPPALLAPPVEEAKYEPEPKRAYIRRGKTDK